jgi:hypothetical protein
MREQPSFVAGVALLGTFASRVAAERSVPLHPELQPSAPFTIHYFETEPFTTTPSGVDPVCKFCRLQLRTLQSLDTIC